MSLNRRSWLSFMLSGAAAASRGLAQNQEPARRLRITTGPYLQSPSDNTMTVMWITDRNATGAVEYGTPDGDTKTVFSSHHGLIDSNERVHKVVLAGLSPGTVYRYRAVSRDILNFGSNNVDLGETVDSGFREFRTPDARKRDLSFLVFNDMHDIPGTFAEMLKVAGDRPYSFVLLNGDSVSYIAKEEEITAMLDAAVAEFASRVPLIWVRGNHETRGKMARQFPQYIDLPGGRYFYSFDQGPVHFIVLDSGEDKVDEHIEYGGQVDFYRYRLEEAEWLKAEVQTEAFRRARYRVVVSHMPFPDAGRRRDPGPGSAPSPFTGMAHCYDNFGPVLEKAGVDLMISGHIHRPAIIDPAPGRHSYPIVQGGGPKGPNRTIIRVNVNDSALEAVVLRPDGTTFGTCRVNPRR